MCSVFSMKPLIALTILAKNHGDLGGGSFQYKYIVKLRRSTGYLYNGNHHTWKYKLQCDIPFNLSYKHAKAGAFGTFSLSVMIIVAFVLCRLIFLHWYWGHHRISTFHCFSTAVKELFIIKARWPRMNLQLMPSGANGGLKYIVFA